MQSSEERRQFCRVQRLAVILFVMERADEWLMEEARTRYCFCKMRLRRKNARASEDRVEE